MGLLVSLFATALCAIVYIRMYRRELPEPIGVKKAVIPVALGLFSPIFSTALVIAFGLLFTYTLGGSIQDRISSPVLGAIVGSFFLAGFTEEFIKFLVFLLTVKIVKPKKVYEFGLLCAGVGFGFTALEETLYGGSGIATAVARIPMFAMHVVFGILMGTHIGLARYNKKEGTGEVGKHRFLAFFLPVLWHTLYDAATTANPGLRAEDEAMQVIYIIGGLIVIIASTVLQFIVLVRFRKNTETYCGMELIQPVPASGENGEPDDTESPDSPV